MPARSNEIPVSTPESIAGLPACKLKLRLPMSVNLGSEFTLTVKLPGEAPAPKKRLFVPDTSEGVVAADKYDSPATATIILSISDTAAEADIAPESLFFRAPQSYIVLLVI